MTPLPPVSDRSTPTLPVSGMWNNLTAAPHRALFFVGAVQLITVMLLWLGVLAGRLGVVPPLPLAVNAASFHVFGLLYGVFPFFVFGFLLTVYPRWLALPPVTRGRYCAIAGLLALGMLLYLPGAMFSATLAAIGVAIHLTGWLTAAATLYALWWRARSRNPYELFLNIALACGALGIGFQLHALLTASAASYMAMRVLGLWLFLGLTLFAVAHRMIPFFSQTALGNFPVVRSAWSLPLAAAFLAGHAALEWLGAARLLPLVDTPLAVIALQHTLRWNFRRSLTVRLLGMLHIAFAWFGLAMALFALQGLADWAGLPGLGGRAPLHAYTIGFATGMLIAMASRVTLGHSGRDLWADNLTWYCFLGVNAAAMLRVAAEFTGGATWLGLNIAAAAAWLVFLIPWTLRYAPLYLRPRADGRPG